MSEENTSVLIVGGGVVGLSAALFLEKQNIPYILIERHRGTSIHPRARGVNVRTMELYNEIAVADQVRETGAVLAPAIGILNGQTLLEALSDFNAEEARKGFAKMGAMGTLGEISPFGQPARITQDLLEPLLLQIARERGGTLYFSTELVSFEQDETDVSAIVLDRASGVQRTIRASYLLAADGANSFVRQKLQASISGQGSLGHLLNVLFKADLREYVRGRELSMCRIDRPEVTGLVTSINLTDIWVFHLVYNPSAGETAEQFSRERIIELLHLALGLPDIEIKIQSVLPWECAMRVADRFQYGRVFLAGDAAHQMPPWGGQGANSGIADVHNLAWKLAAVLHEQAKPELLSSYTDERHPVTYMAAEESAASADKLGLLSLQKFSGNLVERFARLMGFYEYSEPSQAIIHDDIPPSHPMGLDGRPGTRVPHIWLERQGQRISTLDLTAGTSFVLLTGTEGEAWCMAAREVASKFNIELVCYQIGLEGELRDASNEWLAKVSISERGVLLLRPDSIVAWRSNEMVTVPSLELERVIRQILQLQ